MFLTANIIFPSRIEDELSTQRTLQTLTRSNARLLARVATVLILVYPVAAIALHLLPTGFNPVKDALSYYADGPYGWLMTLAFLGLGLGSLLLVLVLASTQRTRPLSSLALVLLGVWSVCRFLAALFPADLPGVSPSMRGQIHDVLGLLAFLSISIAMILLSRTFRREPDWRSLSAPSLAMGVLALAAILLAFVFWFGLLERAFYICAIGWLLLVGTRSARLGT